MAQNVNCRLVMPSFFVHSFKNRQKMTFDDVGVQADQEFDNLEKDTTGSFEYSTK
jgi:hypothetical protein